MAITNVFTGILEDTGSLISLADLRGLIFEDDLRKPRDVNEGEGLELFFSVEYTEKFVVFLHDFVMCMLELRDVKKIMILEGKSILDLSSPSDEALALLFYVNNDDKWRKDARVQG